ncbi:MAG: tRNA (adenosine(37)-N6)-threonylcarbamoyltransferase complex dimerization subunit type 1 TsaB [Clostridia bacterium]|nr:tRNA (adenosine(37)-N6)-threonylcarbamoyltransferase complex dimerization subunit type 1 TsaB [Clostridia bacterium]
MLMLCLSTSGPVASAALIKDGEVISIQCGGRGLTHSQTIMSLGEQALLACGYTPADMDAFAVDAGPGSFTGVRIGVCAVNAMAAAFDKPVVSVSSLEGLLYGLDHACALIDCRNGNGYAMAVSGEIILPPSAVVISELLETLPENILIVGDGAQLHHDTIIAALPSARFADENEIDAAKCGLAAWDKLVAGDTVKEAMPLYLRPSQAERLAKEKK